MSLVSQHTCSNNPQEHTRSLACPRTYYTSPKPPLRQQAHVATHMLKSTPMLAENSNTTMHRAVCMRYSLGQNKSTTPHKSLHTA